MNQSNEIGRYSFQRINPSDLSTFLVFDNKEGIIYIGAYTKEGFYLNSRNAITGEEKIIAKPEIKSN